jgi:hypothetical protein
MEAGHGARICVAALPAVDQADGHAATLISAEMFDEQNKETNDPLLTKEDKQKIAEWRNAPGRVIKWEGRPGSDCEIGGRLISNLDSTYMLGNVGIRQI